MKPEAVVFNRLATELKVANNEDWYKLKRFDIVNVPQGAEILAKHSYSCVKCLEAAFPDSNHKWDEWKFKHFKRYADEFWACMDNQRAFVKHYEEINHFTSNEDWYKVKALDLYLAGGRELSQMYRGSMLELLQATKPDHEWNIKAWNLNKRFWDNHANKRRILRELEEQLNISDLSEWYKVPDARLAELNVVPMLKSKYGGHVAHLVKDMYPEHEWLEWKFVSVPSKLWAKEATRKKFMKWAGSQLGVNSMEDWYSITTRQIVELGGRTILSRYYSNSLIGCLKAIYPEHAWQDLEFATPSTHVWESVANRKEIIELVGKKLGVETLDDWYKVKRGKVLQSRGGAMISRFYGGYLSKCLRHLYPHHNWVDMNFDVIPDNFWTKQENRRMWMNWAGAQLGVKQMEDWYNVKLQSLKGLGMASMFNALHVQRNMFEALRDSFPEHEWLPWKFERISNRIFDSREDRLKFMKWIEAPLGVVKMEDWYNVTGQQVKKQGTRMLGKFYKGSLFACLKDLYPEHEWLDWKFRIAPQGVWSTIENQKKFIEWVSSTNNITDLSQWYSTPPSTVIEYGGRSLLNIYNGSLVGLLKAVYPLHSWLPWKFTSVPMGWWGSLDNQKQFFEWAGTQLGVRSIEDWANISSKQVEDLGGSGLLGRYPGNSLVGYLQAVYPSHQWHGMKRKTLTKSVKSPTAKCQPSEITTETSVNS